MHSYCSWPVFPKNCSVMCQDSGADQRRPSALDCSRTEIAESSSITAAASGIPTKRRIPESVAPYSPDIWGTQQPGKPIQKRCLAFQNALFRVIDGEPASSIHFRNLDPAAGTRRPLHLAHRRSAAGGPTPSKAHAAPPCRLPAAPRPNRQNPLRGEARLPSKFTPARPREDARLPRTHLSK